MSWSEVLHAATTINVLFGIVNLVSTFIFWRNRVLLRAIHSDVHAMRNRVDDIDKEVKQVEQDLLQMNYASDAEFAQRLARVEEQFSAYTKGIFDDGGKPFRRRSYDNHLTKGDGNETAGKNPSRR
ncbi:MAG: hypothetical protein ACKO0Z_08030 [Betaproteobacteria bacterium]